MTVSYPSPEHTYLPHDGNGRIGRHSSVSHSSNDSISFIASLSLRMTVENKNEHHKVPIEVEDKSNSGESMPPAHITSGSTEWV